MYRLCGHFQQLQPNGVNPLFFHVCGKRQPSEPIEQVVGKNMYLQAVCIDHFGVTAHGGKVKSAFSFLDEVLYTLSEYSDKRCYPQFFIIRTF